MGSPYWPLRTRPDTPGFDDWLAFMRKVSTRPAVPHQHVVSRALLRFFSMPKTHNAHAIGTVVLKTRRYEERAPKSCGALRNWTSEFSGESEDLWQRVESDMPAAIDAALNRSVHGNVNLLINLKAATALHYLRSLATRRTGQSAADEAMSEIFNEVISDPMKRKWLEDHFQTVHGRRAQALGELRKIFVEVARSSRRFDIALAFRKKIGEAYVEMADYFARCRMEMLIAPNDRDFVLGDTPVTPVGPAPVGTPGKHYVPPLLDAEAVYFPIHPKVCLKFPVTEDHYVVIGGRVVDRINEVQISRSYRHVYFRPSARSQNFVLEKARSWKAWPEISDLTLR